MRRVLRFVLILLGALAVAVAPARAQTRAGRAAPGPPATPPRAAAAGDAGSRPAAGRRPRTNRGACSTHRPWNSSSSAAA